MANLKRFSVEELKAELAEREAAQGAPQPLPDPNWAPVYKFATDLVNDKVEGEPMCDDLPQYCFEAVMEAVYGQKFWNWWCRQ